MQQSLSNVLEKMKRDIIKQPQSIWFIFSMNLLMFRLILYTIEKRLIVTKAFKEILLYKPNPIFEWLYSDFFVILCSKKQYHTVHQLFEETPELKDRLKPIYFLTMEYLKDEYPNEYLKAGEEMRETIEELKERVKWFEENLK